VIRTPQTVAQLDGESVVVRAVKGTSVRVHDSGDGDQKQSYALILNDGRSTKQ
jgi:hypothetical protein